MAANLIKVKLSELIQHEQYREDHKEELKEEIKKDGILKRPIAVHKLENDSGKYMIIDGHHRTQSLKELGCKHIIANSVDYFSPDFKVLSWDGDREWGKNEIVKFALNGRLLAPKTTKHVIVNNGKHEAFQDNDFVEPFVNCPLEELK